MMLYKWIMWNYVLSFYVVLSYSEHLIIFSFFNHLQLSDIYNLLSKPNYLILYCNFRFI